MGNKRRTLLKDRDKCKERVRELYLQGMEPKVISNKEGIDLGLVMKIIQDSKRDPEFMILLQNSAVNAKSQFASEAGQKITSNFSDTKNGGKEEIKVVKKRKPSVSEDTKLDIACDYETGKFTYKELADKYDISSATVGKICQSLIPEEKRKDIKMNSWKESRKHSATKKNETVSKTSLKEIPFTKAFINVGLIANRHDVPVNRFIFNNIEDDKIDNYDWQEQIVNEFINKNVKFNSGIPEFGLQVFVTGLQCALGTLFKVCKERKVNLTLKHYNPNLDKYIPQIIMSDFPTTNPIPSSLWGQSFSNDRIYTYNCNINEIDKMKGGFYGMNVVSRLRKTNDIEDKFIIFAPNESDMYKVYIEKLQEMSNDKEHKHEFYLDKFVKQNSEWKSILIQKAFTA